MDKWCVWFFERLAFRDRLCAWCAFDSAVKMKPSTATACAGSNCDEKLEFATCLRWTDCADSVDPDELSKYFLEYSVKMNVDLNLVEHMRIYFEE